jgi:hypothetical protein
MIHSSIYYFMFHDYLFGAKVAVGVCPETLSRFGTNWNLMLELDLNLRPLVDPIILCVHLSLSS